MRLDQRRPFRTNARVLDLSGFLAGALLALVVVTLALRSDPTDRASLGTVVGSTTPTPALDLISSADLRGWAHEGTGGFDASVEDGVPVYISAGGPGLLRYDRQLGDFEVELEFSLAAPGADAGVLVHVQYPVGEAPFQVDIQHDPDGASAIGDLVGVQQPMIFIAPAPGEWHTMRVRLRDRRVTVWIDDLHVNDYLEQASGPSASLPAKGHLALENGAGSVRFRNIRLADLSR